MCACFATTFETLWSCWRLAELVTTYKLQHSQRIEICKVASRRSMYNAHIVHDIIYMRVMSGMHAEAEVLCRQKEAAAANRKDSKLKAVVISEAWDKKAGKYNAPSVPFPFDSKATYEQSMRTPMGREFNTTAAHRQDTVFCDSITLLTIMFAQLYSLGC